MVVGPNPTFYSPNLLEGADRVAGQLRGDKEYPFSDVTKSGGVWRKVPESDAARSVHNTTFLFVQLLDCTGRRSSTKHGVTVFFFFIGCFTSTKEP